MDDTISQEGFQTLDMQDATQRNEQMTLFDMQTLAVKKTGSISELQKQIKVATEMLTDTFKNNAEYHSQEERAKEAGKPLKEVKAIIERTPEVISLKTRLKELKNELKEKRSEVSEYALEVYRQTGQREFDLNGEVYEINTVAKLSKRKQ